MFFKLREKNDVTLIGSCGESHLGDILKAPPPLSHPKNKLYLNFSGGHSSHLHFQIEIQQCQRCASIFFLLFLKNIVYPLQLFQYLSRIHKSIKHQKITFQNHLFGLSGNKIDLFTFWRKNFTSHKYFPRLPCSSLLEENPTFKIKHQQIKN